MVGIVSAASEPSVALPIDFANSSVNSGFPSLRSAIVSHISSSIA